MRNLKKVLSITAAAAMAVSTVTPVSVFADDATFKIGGIGPVTGAAAIYGQAVKNASNQDLYWRIIRTNSDGSVRLLYHGTVVLVPWYSSLTVPSEFVLIILQYKS